MIGRSSLLSFSRRRVLITTSAAVALVAIAGLVPAQGADRSRDGGDITFLIDSLGNTWIPTTARSPASRATSGAT